MGQTQFKIGSHYRQRNGEVVKVIREEGYSGKNRENYPGLRALVLAAGGWRNINGACMSILGTRMSSLDLLPGELKQNAQGEWVPVEEEKEEPAKSIGALLREKLTFPLTQTPTLDKLENTSEPHRPALTWNKPTPFDAFPGFTVTRYDVEDLMPAHDHSHPLQRTSEGERNPAFGSAALLKVR